MQNGTHCKRCNMFMPYGGDEKPVIVDDPRTPETAEGAVYYCVSCWDKLEIVERG